MTTNILYKHKRKTFIPNPMTQFLCSSWGKKTFFLVEVNSKFGEKFDQLHKALAKFTTQTSFEHTGKSVGWTWLKAEKRKKKPTSNLKLRNKSNKNDLYWNYKQRFNSRSESKRKVWKWAKWPSNELLNNVKIDGKYSKHSKKFLEI